MSYFLKILAIHDESALWDSVCEWLEDAGYAVFHPENGRSALELYQQELPHIVVVDNALPGGWYDLCQTIKDLPTAVSPLILLAIQNKELFSNSGDSITDLIDDFLPLPLTKRELLLKINLVNRLMLAESEREILLNIASLLQNIPVNNAVLPNVLAELQHLFFANSIGFTVPDKLTGEPFITEAHGKLAHLSGKRIPNDDSGLHRLLQSETATTLLIENFEAWQEEFGFVMNGSGLKGTKSFATVPLQNETNNFGVLWLGSTYTIKPKITRFLSAIASLLTTALQKELWVSEVKQANVELEERVAERTEELSLAYRRLQELDQMKSNFVANVSHELRLPINNLLLYLDLLNKGNAEKRDGYEAQLRLNTERLNRLVDNILNLSRLEAQRGDDPLLPIDLNALVEGVVSMIASSIKEKAIDIQYQPDLNLPPVRGNKDQLIQVMTNLLNNAVKYTDRGQIYVRTLWQCTEETVCFTVTDTGMGILPEDIPNIFNRFFRGRQSVRSQVPGSGLGLSIVREIVEQHNGRITVKSAPGKGSTFTVCLPPLIL